MEQLIKMPRITNNDDFVTLGCWYVKNGDAVKEGDALASLETAKETKDLIAESGGYILYEIEMGTETAVGEIIAKIQDEPVEIEDKSEKPLEKIMYGSDHISKKALRLIEKYNLDITSFPNDKIVKEKDVLKLINHKKSETQSPANEILIVCGGSIAKMCIDTLRGMGGYRFGGIIDIYAEVGKNLMGVPCVGNIAVDVLEEKYKEGFRTAVNAYGGMVSSNEDKLFFARKELYETIKGYNYFMPNLIHPKASVESSVTMGEGNLIFAEAYIGSDAFIGNDCIINTGAIISHDCVIEDHCRISPGAVLAGNVSVGENTIVGMGVTVYMKVKIGKNVIIHNGKHIFNDIPDNAVVK